MKRLRLERHAREWISPRIAAPGPVDPSLPNSHSPNAAKCVLTRLGLFQDRGWQCWVFLAFGLAWYTFYYLGGFLFFYFFFFLSLFFWRSCFSCMFFIYLNAAIPNQGCLHIYGAAYYVCKVRAGTHCLFHTRSLFVSWSLH